MKSGDGRGGIRMLVLVVIEQQCLNHDRNSGQGHIFRADTKQWQGESERERERDRFRQKIMAGIPVCAFYSTYFLIFGIQK